MDRKKILALLLSVILLIFSGCHRAPKQKSEKPIVYASFYPIYNMVETVAGDSVEVCSFMPPDKEAHYWEPTSKDIKKLSEADLLVVNGANMERWLDKIRESLPNLKVLVLSDSVDLITYKGAAAIGDFQYMAQFNLSTDKNEIEFGHTHEDIMRIAFIDNKENLPYEKLVEKGKKIMQDKGKLIKQKETIDVEDGLVYGIEMGHESGSVNFSVPTEGNWVFISDRLSEENLPYILLDSKGNLLEKEVFLEGNTSQLDKITYDPHSWLSLVNAKKYFNAIQEQLTDLYPDNRNLYRKNKVQAVDEITDLEYEFKTKFKDVRIREFVTTHNAYAYLARDFDLKQFPLQGLTSMEDPSLKTIKTAIDYCNTYGINTIFYEYGGIKYGGEAIAEEIGGRLEPLASMEFVTAEQKKKGERYIDLMRMNIENLYHSMK